MKGGTTESGMNFEILDPEGLEVDFTRSLFEFDGGGVVVGRFSFN